MPESADIVRREPAWSLPRGVIVLLGLAGLVIAIAGIKGFANVLGPVFLALMLTVAVHPFPDWLRRKGWPRWLATLLALVCVYSILALMAILLIVSVARLGTILPQYQGDIDELLDGARSALDDVGIGSQQAGDLLAGIDAATLFSAVTAILESVVGLLSNLVFVIVLLMFMAVDGSTYSQRVRELADPRPDIAHALNSFSSGTRKYLVVATVFGAIVAVLDTGLLWAMGIPLPLLWGLLSFITNYIPNIGFVLGLVPPAFLGLLQGGVGTMLTVIVLYSVVNVVIQSIIQPKFVGDAVGLSVTLTFLSLVFWSWVLGPLGAILAIPLTLFAKALLIDIDPATRWADVLLAGNPPADEPPEEPEPIPAEEAVSPDTP